MSDKELFEKYAEICDHRQRRLMDVQETALFCALRDMLKRGAKQAELVNGPTQSTISHDDWYALCNERDALRADNERLRGLLTEALDWIDNAPHHDGCDSRNGDSGDGSWPSGRPCDCGKALLAGEKP